MSGGEEITAAETTSHNGGDSPLCRELTVVDTVDVTPIETAPFELPEGWTVEKVPCDDDTREYKVYYEPGTGRSFESLRAVERHLKDPNCTPSLEASNLGSSFEKHYERRVRRKVVPLIADDKYFPSKERKSSSKGLKVHSGAKSSHVRKSIVSGGMLLKLDNKKLVVVPDAEAVVSPFNLPDGWVVEEVPRRHTANNHTDKYYYEPGTGRRFHSLLSVKRHLAEAEEGKPLAAMFDIGSNAKNSPGKKSRVSVGKSSRARSIVSSDKSSDVRKSIVSGEKNSQARKSILSGEKSSQARKSIVSGGKLLKLDNQELVVRPNAESDVACVDLPDGWVVEEVPRLNTSNGYSDKYYYEPGTGKKFPSLASAKRHLAQTEEEDRPLAVMFNIESPAKKLDLKYKKSREKVSSTTFEPATPPAKIKWVLTDNTEGSTFIPYIGETMVAEPVVQRWAKRFLISINGGNHTAPSFEWLDIFLMTDCEETPWLAVDVLISGLVLVLS